MFERNLLGQWLHALTGDIWRLALGSIPFAAIVLVWLGLSAARVVEPVFLPSLDAVGRSLIAMFQGGFTDDIIASILRVLGGFALSGVIAVPLGILMGASRRADQVFSPFISFMRYLPATAFIPLLILWTGIGDLQKVLLLFMGMFFYQTLLTVNIVSQIRREYLDVASTLGATRMQVLLHVIVPASLPGIYDSLRVMAAVGWTYIVVAEMVAATSGIGKVIIESQRFLQTAKVIAGITTIGLVGALCDLLFRIGRPLLFRWAVVRL